MTSVAGILILTARELWAMRITQGVFVLVTLVMLVMSFAMNLDVVEGSLSALRIFGLDATPGTFERDPQTGEANRTALSIDQFVLGINQFVFGATYFFGTLLGLFATMPLLGGFLEEGRIDLLLSKPITRSRLLLGHVVGVWLTVLALTLYLVAGVWMIISFKSGVWLPRQLLVIPFILVMFGVMYAVMLWVAIRFRSTGLALVTSYGLIFLSLFLVMKDEILPLLGSVATVVYTGLYYILPNFVEGVAILSQLTSGQAVESWPSVLSTLLFGAVLYALSFIDFSRRDF